VSSIFSKNSLSPAVNFLYLFWAGVGGSLLACLPKRYVAPIIRPALQTAGWGIAGGSLYIIAEQRVRWNKKSNKT
jgi:hypothetical protein